MFFSLRSPVEAKLAIRPHLLALPPLTLAPIAGDLLLDGAEDRMAGGVQHLDLDAVAKLQKWRVWLTFQDGLHRAQLGQTRVTDAALLDRFGRPSLALVGHRAGADNAAGAERARLGRVGDELGNENAISTPALGLPISLPL